MDIVVQHVTVEWTKQSRGGAGANRRNAVPLGYPLPGAVLGGGVHHVSHRERDDFAPSYAAGAWIVSAADQPTFRRRVHGPPRSPAAWTDHEVRVHPDGDEVVVELRPARYGSPRRDFGPAPVTVAPGTSLAWHINRRLVGLCDGHWFYRLDTYRVAVAPVAPDAFLDRATRVVDERAHLF